MSDMVIIVTRMRGNNDNEFCGYFSNNEWAVTYNRNNEVSKISRNNHDELAYDSKIILVYVDGMKVQNSDNHRDSLRAFLNSAMDNEKEIFILVHQGAQYDIREAKGRILNSVKQNNSVEEDKKYIIADYSKSNGEGAIYGIVKELASAINKKYGNIQDCIEKVKEYIKKNAYKLPPIHLIALFILCQGYLAAHGEADNLDGWNEVWENLPKNLKDEEKKYQLVEEKRKTTELRSWWNPALEDVIQGKESETGKELKALGKDIEDIQLVKIIQDTEFFYNETLIPAKEDDFTNKVNEAYEKLSGILEGRF